MNPVLAAVGVLAALLLFARGRRFVAVLTVIAFVGFAYLVK